MQKELGKVIHSARTEQRMSLRKLATVTGLSPSQISHIENGNRDNPTFRTVCVLVDALGLQLAVVAKECGFLRTDASAEWQLSAREKLALKQIANDLIRSQQGLQQIVEKADTSAQRLRRARMSRRRSR